MTGKAGNTTRLNQMLSYFNENENISVQFVSLKDWGNWTDEHLKSFKKTYNNVRIQLLNKKYKSTFLKYLFLYKIPYLFKSNKIDITSLILRRDFNKIIKATKFDAVVISYALWGKLIDEIPYETYKILDTHDFITGQRKNKHNSIGKLFQDEMEILRSFDEIWTYSVEEQYIFEQFTDRKITLIPVSFPLNFESTDKSFVYDVIYVASNNPHNIAGIKWFLKEVLPHLQDVKIHIVGNICKEIDDYDNVIKHGLVDDLTAMYRSAKIAICPMLSGTGIKIKVVEALSYGIPVVTNKRGVDGLINKTENGCIVTDDPKKFAEKMMHLLQNEEFYTKTKGEAISYFKNNHDPELELELLNTIFK